MIDPILIEVIIAAVAGLIACDYAWKLVNEAERKANAAQEAQHEAWRTVAYPETMTQDECKRINASRWD